ncbi:MAG: GNVR domain-containing protein [bacterium]|nr:GNVR domain-containing protein [bacterium]
MEHSDKIATGNYLNTIKRVLFKRWWLILLITFVVSISAFITSKIVEPVYEASTSIRVQSPVQLTGGTSNRQTFGQTSLGPEAMWLRSRYLLELVMKNLGIGNINNKEEYVAIMEKLVSNINVQTFEGANTLVLTVRWNDAEMVAKITNTLADTFIEKYQLFNNALAKDKRVYIEEQLNLIRIKLDEVQRNLSDFQKKEGIISLDEEIKEVTSRIATWGARRYQIEMDIKIAQARFNQLKEQMPQTKGESGKDLQALFFKDNSALSAMQQNISNLEAEINSMSYKYTDEFSPLLIKKKKLEEIKSSFQAELTRATSGYKSDNNPKNKDFILDLVQTEMEIEAKQNEQIFLDDLIKKEQEKIKTLPEKQIRYIDILRENKVNEEQYTNLLKRLAEARIEENVDMWDVRVFDRAYQPFQPLKPRPVKNTIFGAIIGLVLGIGLSMIFEYFDDSFHSVDEVELFLGLPVLAAIPKMKK